MSSNALYTDLSGYYDLMCTDIDYPAQSDCIQRLHTLFGNGGKRHLDLACGTGPHIRHFIDRGFQCRGLDLNAPMLDLARIRCPEAQFSVENMCQFLVEEPADLITCFLYSIHYSGLINNLQQCLESVHSALSENGLFCFNAVAKDKIQNDLFVRHSAIQENSQFHFSSAWHYPGVGEQQTLRLSIERITENVTESWQDEHPMVAVSFSELQQLLAPLFEVHIFNHNYDTIQPWDQTSGNAIFVCVKH